MDSELIEIFLLIMCFVVIGVFTWLIIRHGTALMGFTIFAAFFIFLTNLSAFFIAKVFFLPMEATTPAHLVVWAYTLAALLAYALGVWFAWRPLRQGMRRLNPFVAEPKLILVFAVVGALITLFASVLPYIPSLSPVLFQLSMLIQLAFLGALSSALERGDYGKLVAALAIFIPVGMITVVTTGFAGMMGSFMLQPLMLFLFYRKPAWWKAGVFAAGVYVFFMVASVWFATRGIIRDGGLQGLETSEKVKSFYSQFAKAVDASIFEPETVRNASRLRVDLSVYNILQADWMGKNEPYSKGRSLFVDPVLALIPRLLWPGKTISLGDSEFINRYTGLTLSNSSISVDTNMTFEFYANFGWPGVIIGLFGFGYAMAWMELRLVRPGNSLTTILVLAILLLGLNSGGRRAAAMMLEKVPAVIGAVILGKMLESSTLLKTRFSLAAPPRPAGSGLPPLPPRRLRRLR